MKEWRSVELREEHLKQPFCRHHMLFPEGGDPEGKSKQNVPEDKWIDPRPSHLVIPAVPSVLACLDMYIYEIILQVQFHKKN